MKLLVEFDHDNVQEPTIAESILETGISVGIERAMVDGDDGWVLLAIDKKDVDAFVKVLKKHGVCCHIQKDSVIYNKKECVSCGLCISLCIKQVFSFDADWNLSVDADKCVLCGRCASFCPQRALSIQNCQQ